MICLNTKKKLKSCMLHWHLLHSNSLWGPVNQVSSLTTWNSTDANLAKLPFMGPALKLQAPLWTAKSKDSSLQHTQSAYPASGSAKHTECKVENQIVTEVTKDSEQYPWTIFRLSLAQHRTISTKMLSENRKVLSSESVTRGTCDTLWTCTCSTLD